MKRAAIVLGLLLAGCGDGDKGKSFSVQVTSIPAGTTAIEAAAWSAGGESEATFQGAAVLAQIEDGVATVAVASAESTGRLEIAIRARRDTCVIADGRGGCDLPACEDLVIALAPSAHCDGPDAGMPLDDGR